ncbi:MAG: Alpha-xylosidase [Labilithrix sp.]|nr:Alpha-xylosidase [Labilithrix sp.]
MGHPRSVALSSLLSLALAAVAAACSSDDAAPANDAGPALPAKCTRTDLDSPPPVVPHTPRWAFEPWISKDISDRADTYAYVDGFRDRGIPVGAVVLDSPWETSYNTFVPNPDRYGDFPSLVDDLHRRDVKVVLWITSMVNESSFDFEPGGDRYPSSSPNLEEGDLCHYFVQDGARFGWWKGLGASVDFFNPSARAWWHRQQDLVLAAKIDGWKLDFGESYVKSDPVQTAEGPKPHQEYSEKYYEDFLAYGQSVRGPEFLTMVRAWDESYEFAGRFFAKKDHAPVTWMGDNRRDYVGLADALQEMFVSAKAGYVVVGSDIGGYLDHDDKNLLGPAIPFDSLNFARWTALGALTPFMQLHGRGAIAPWTLPDHADETVALYRYWATLHHALVPFFFSLAEKGYAADASAASILHPIGDAASWAGDYRYLLGDALLVAPLLDATGKRAVALPAGARWYDWWTGAPADGGTTVQADFAADRAKIPLYVKEGAILPLDVDSDVLALGTAASRGARTILGWPASAMTSFRIHETGGNVDVTLQGSASGWSLTLSAAPAPVILRIRTETAPAQVTGGGTFTYDPAAKTTVVTLPASPGPVTVTATL